MYLCDHQWLMRFSGVTILGLMKNIEKWEQGENLAQMIDYRLYGKPSGKAGLKRFASTL